MWQLGSKHFVGQICIIGLDLIDSVSNLWAASVYQPGYLTMPIHCIIPKYIIVIETTDY